MSQDVVDLLQQWRAVATSAVVSEVDLDGTGRLCGPLSARVRCAPQFTRNGRHRRGRRPLPSPQPGAGMSRYHDLELGWTDGDDQDQAFE